MGADHRLRILVMGVSGSGKSTFGAALAQRLGIGWQEGDALHSPESIAKMAKGIALDDQDRWPWLARIAHILQERAPVVLGCSALKRSYRDLLRRDAGGPLRIIHLHGSRALLLERMAARPGHFMPAALLDSQLATLEPPQPDEHALTLDLALSPDAQIKAALAALG